MKYEIAQIVGLNTDQTAAQVTSEVLEGNNLFLAAVKLTCDDAFTKGRELLSGLSQFYAESEGGIAQKLAATFEEAKKNTRETEAPEFLLGYFSGKALYLIRQGKIEVFLKRGEKLSALFPAGSSDNQLISGFVSEGDKIFLGTKSLVEFLGEGINQSLDIPTDEWKEEINAKIAQADFENIALAGLVLSLDPEEVEAEAAIPRSLNTEDRVETIPAFSDGEKSGGKVKFNPAVLFGNIAVVKKFIPRSDKGRLTLAVVLILVLLVGGGLKYKNIKDLEKQQNFQKFFDLAQNDFNAAASLQTLNPPDAQTKLDQAKNELDQALKIKPGNSQALQLKQQINDSEDKILQKFDSLDTPLFLDLSLIKKDFAAKNLSYSDGKILILDPQEKTLAAVDVTKKSQQVLAGEKQLGSAKIASLSDSTAFVYSLSKGVVKIDLGSQKDNVVAKSDSDWGQIVDVAGFGSNIYLLDSGKSKIWKYIPASGSYADKREYLSKDVKTDLTGAVRMQIESSIYVLKQNGEILRFTKGSSDTFSFQGLDQNLANPVGFFTSSDVDNLYILDTGNSRILVVTKTGVYKQQYHSDKFTKATDLVVSEGGKKAYFLVDNKIYSLDLK